MVTVVWIGADMLDPSINRNVFGMIGPVLHALHSRPVRRRRSLSLLTGSANQSSVRVEECRLFRATQAQICGPTTDDLRPHRGCWLRIRREDTSSQRLRGPPLSNGSHWL